MLQVALRWFCSRSLLRAEGLTKELIDRIPGKQTDRKTPLGELNWIFTAITDTIAWNMLPRALFQRLFRQACRHEPEQHWASRGRTLHGGSMVASQLTLLAGGCPCWEACCRLALKTCLAGLQAHQVPYIKLLVNLVVHSAF